MKPQQQISDKVPYSADAENYVIGSMISAPDETIESLGLYLKPNHFFQTGARIAFQVMLDMRKEKIPIELQSIVEQLKKQGREKDCPMGYLGEAVCAVGTHLNVSCYAKTVRDLYWHRSMWEKLREMAVAVRDLTLGPTEFEEAVGHMKQLCSEVWDSDGAMPHFMAIDLMLEEMRQWKASPRLTRGIPYGWNILDHWTGGMKPGELIFLAAPPGGGKTAALLNMIEWSATPHSVSTPQGEIEESVKCGFISLEMTVQQIMQRMAANVLNIESDRFNQKPTDEFIAEVEKIRVKTEKWKWVVNDLSLDLRQVCKSIRSMVRLDGCQVVFLDYLQIIKPADPKISRFEHVTQCANELMALAKELQVPIVCLAQLNRAGKKSDQPTMSDLDGAGVIENNAHVIIILTNPHKEGERFVETGGHYKKVWIVDKNRSGRTGRINMDWIPKYQRFDESSDQSFSTKGKQ
jgi:replicative DNA helicase